MTDEPSPRRALEALLGVPFTDGNEVRVLRNGAQAFPVILDEIRAATRSVDLLWFTWETSQIAERVAAALADRARHGVRVRVLLDAFGALHVDRALIGRMRAAGCAVRFYRPLLTWRVTTVNRRCHRRVLVCDERTALTGGIGVSPNWTGDADTPRHWRDSAVLLRGPAVAGLRAAFASNWVQGPRPLLDDADRFPPAEAPGTTAVQVLRADSAPGWNDAALAVLTMARLARRRLRVSTPYARLTPRFHDLLAETVRRGVQVQLMVCWPYVARPFVRLQSQRGYRRLLDDGVEIWCYQPTLLHAKIMTVDEQVSMLGTVNLDIRALTINEQVGLIFDDRGVTAMLDEHFDDDLAHSTRLREHDWRSRGRRQRLLEVVADVAGVPPRGIGGTGMTGPQPGNAPT